MSSQVVLLLSWADSLQAHLQLALVHDYFFPSTQLGIFVAPLIILLLPKFKSSLKPPPFTP